MLKYTIVIPAHNEADYITKCLQSIVNQKYNVDLVEVIIIDNCSTDQTHQVVKNFIKQNKDLKLRMIKENIKGINHARNAGGRNAKGEVVIFLDADNFVESDFLNQIDYLYDKLNYKAGCFYTIPDSHRILDKFLFYILHAIKIILRRPFGKNFVARNILDDLDYFDTSILIGTSTNFNSKTKKYCKNKKLKFSIANIKVYASMRRFKKEGYGNVLMLWFLGYIGIRKRKTYFT